MKPSKFSLLTLVSFLLAASVGIAEEGGRKVKPRTERLARASWSPVRQPAIDRSGTSRVTTAQAVEDLPAPSPQKAPTPVPMESVDQYAPHGGYFDGPIVDGPIVDGPIIDGAIVDGSLRGGPILDERFTGGVGCDAAGYCDSIGCNANCRAHHGWLPWMTFCVPQDGWFSAEYLLWYQKGLNLPPLATSNAIDVAPRLAPGLGTNILFGGDDDYLEGSLDGLRLSFGFFLDHCHEWSVAADYFGWSQISENAFFIGTPNQSLGRPILNAAEAGLPRAQLVNFTGLNSLDAAVDVDGTLGINVSSELRSGGFQFRRFFVCRDGCGDTIFMNLPANYRSRTDLGIGYRYTELDESLFITESLTFPGATAPNDALTMSDRFVTRTQFNGFDFGMFYTRHRGCWTLDLQGRFGIGVNNQQVNISGLSTGAINAQSGLLAAPSNANSYSRDRLAILPEFRANIGYLLTPRLKATVGYTFMYWSNVVRPGDQVDLLVDRDAITGTPIGNPTGVFPQFRFNETDYWVQGVSFGAEYRW